MGIIKQIPEVKEASDVSVNKYYERLDEELAESEFVAGDRFTVADITLVTGIDFATTLVGLKPDDSLANLWRWHEQILSRDSVDDIVSSK
jgi:glutathione S-transferase